MEYHKYYLERLYPLQDRFLKFFNNQNQGRFYLTGGTALSRFYYQHRYSEDLDFFSTAEFKDFRTIVTKFLDSARQEGFLIEVETLSDHFFRIYAKEKEISLKVDFVNEVTFRSNSSNGRLMSNLMKFMAIFSSSLRIFCWDVLTV